jgi:acylphosphatase
MTEARRVHVEGRVQGVGFRWSTMSHARLLGVGGWVRNSPGGGVEAFVQGEPSSVEAMVEWLREGPGGAAVLDVRVEDASPDPSLGVFEIRG